MNAINIYLENLLIAAENHYLSAEDLREAFALGIVDDQMMGWLRGWCYN